MQTTDWAPFPHDATPFTYSGKSLEKNWKALHAGDREPFPDAARAGAIGLKPAEQCAEQLAEAWRLFHAGDFAAAVDRAESVGMGAHAVANKASGIYADYLVDDETEQELIYKAGIARAETAMDQFPEDANAHYFHAFLLGRYSQCISIAKALAQGVGGRIRASLERALELEPEHAEAHTAMGLYHAEIIDKVGKMVGSMTYGASADKAMKHFEQALELTPNAPIAHIEYGNGLYLLFGDKRLEDSNAAYERAANIEPIDAMQRLDVDYARSCLE